MAELHGENRSFPFSRKPPRQKRRRFCVVPFIISDNTEKVKGFWQKTENAGKFRKMLDKAQNV